MEGWRDIEGMGNRGMKDEVMEGWRNLVIEGYI